MRRVLLVTNYLQDAPLGGRELLCKLNHDALMEIYGNRLLKFEVPRQAVRGIRLVLNAFRGHIDGLDEVTIGRALQVIQSENVDKVFVDGSNLGELIRAVKLKLLGVEVITFFHNVEAQFFLGSARLHKTLRATMVLMINYLAEKKSVRYSDKIICLSERDSNLLREVYGRSATHISPLALHDRLAVRAAENHPLPPNERFALFVGGRFYANLAGIAWYVQHVVPLIDIKTCIVGRGLETFRKELDREGKVTVVGSVDSLEAWYANAQFVIAPIFGGSGMKTKVAEALMHGKKIVGTPEAFSGYEEIAQRAGWVCRTAEEFVAAIGRAQEEVTLGFDPELRRLYEERYSFRAAQERLAGILESVR